MESSGPGVSAAMRSSDEEARQRRQQRRSRRALDQDSEEVVGSAVGAEMARFDRSGNGGGPQRDGPGSRRYEYKSGSESPVRRGGAVSEGDKNQFPSWH